MYLIALLSEHIPLVGSTVGIVQMSNPPTPACGMGFTLVAIAGCAGDFGGDFVGGTNFFWVTWVDFDME